MVELVAVTVALVLIAIVATAWAVRDLEHVRAGGRTSVGWEDAVAEDDRGETRRARAYAGVEDAREPDPSGARESGESGAALLPHTPKKHKKGNA